MFDPPKPRVFVVDDESVISSTLAIHLSQSGFIADAFTNPLEALLKVKDNRPDLLISDVMMPEMTVVDLAIRMRSAVPKCRILLFSGQATTTVLLDKARANGHDFTLLTKPIHSTDLLHAVRKL